MSSLFKVKDISTLDFSTLDFSTMNFLTPLFKNLHLKSSGLWFMVEFSWDFRPGVEVWG
jgi:hypothetical protein